MAKISQLPLVAGPTGAETVVVLDVDGITKRVPLAPLATAAIEPSLSRAEDAANSAADSVKKAQDIVNFGGVIQHITDASFSVTDEQGNAGVAFDGETFRVDQFRVRALTVDDPSSAGLPVVHITDAQWSIADPNGWALAMVSSDGTLAAAGFALSDGSKVGAGGAPKYLAGTTIAQIDGVCITGQSNGSGDPNNVTSPPVNQVQPYANLTPLYGYSASATTYDSGDANMPVQKLVPLLAPAGYAEWGGIQGANQITAMLLRDTSLGVADVPQMYSFNSAFRGSGIDPVGNQANGVSFKTAIAAGVAGARAMNKTYNHKAIWFTQGEANAATSEADYYTALLQLYDWQNAYVKATTGQTNDVEFFLWQIQEKTGPASASVLASHRHPRIHCAFPEYACQQKVGNAGHFDAVGMALSSAYYGVATKRVCYDRQAWQPLEHLALQRRGTRSVAITYNRKGLVFESDQPNARWPAQAGRGFYGADANGALNVVSAVISDLGIVTVTFDRDLSAAVGSLTFGYGVAMTGRPDQSGITGGELRDCAGLAETTTIGGTVYPLHNYALRFEETL